METGIPIAGSGDDDVNDVPELFRLIGRETNMHNVFVIVILLQRL